MAAKKALTVGINIYEDPRQNLNGCVNDSFMIQEMLKKHFGFARNDITVLLNERATRENIVRELDNLVADSGPGDVLVFHYSGHGSQIVDINGDEDDSLDEIICPHDMDWNNPLTDDDISRILRVGSGVNLTMLMDCCHSGSINREMADPGIPVPVKNRHYPAPTALMANKEELRRLKKKSFRSQKEAPVRLISGCRDNQTSSDAWIDGAYHGAFTFYLNETLRNNQYEIGMGHLRDQVAAALAAHNFTQEPVLSPETAADEPFLYPVG